MKKEFKVLGKTITLDNIYDVIKVLAKIGLLLLIFVSMYLLAHSVLLSPDDYNYTYVQGNPNRVKVDSVEHALDTARYFYFNWTGRILPHVAIGVVRNLPPQVYEIANSIVFLIFIVMITKVLNKKSTFLPILGVFGYLSFSMMFGEKFAWISGSFNYLWPSMLLAVFVYYTYNFFKGEKELNIVARLALVLYAFVVGFTHENVAFVGGAFLVCLILFGIKDFLKFDTKKKLAIILIFIMFCLGAFATIFAPGNLERMSAVSGEEKEFTFTWEFMNNYKQNKKVLTAVGISMIVSFIAINFKHFKEKEFKEIEYKEFLNQILFFILPALIATLPMIVISYFPPRAFLAYEVMFMIVFARNIYLIADSIKKYNVLVAVISVVCTLVVFGKFSPSTLAQINYLIPYKDKVTKQYERAVEIGEKDVLVSKFEYQSWIHADDFINISNFFPELNYHMPTNALISQYYGFDRVTAIGDADYLIEIKVDTEGINPYEVIDKNSNQSVQHMEYDDCLRYCIPKDKLGTYVLDCRENGLKDKVIYVKVRAIDGDLSQENYTIDDIILTK